jgi:histidinol-phosphate/aromatic aminotransferase/cobyric acid decarboxylase-like protein
VTGTLSASVRADREAEYAALQSEHGGYWRHGFTDHAYIYNLHFPPESLFEALSAQIHELVLNYPVAQDVVAALIGRLIGQPAERLVVGNGAAELIKILSRTVATKLIIPVPSFNEYANAVPDGRAIEFALDAPSFELDVDRFAAEAIRCGADVAVIVSPNNPTSLLVPRADVLRLAGMLAPHGCMLVVDESFIDFAAAGAAESVERDVGTHANLAVMKSMSKAYGICGLRIGYLLTANADFAARMRDGLHIWNLNGFAEAFLRVAPDYRQDFSESCLQVADERDAFYEDLLTVDGLTVYRPQANYLMCRLPDDAPTGPEVTHALFVEDHIYIKHCEGKTMPESNRYVRIASRTTPENRALVAALKRVLAAAAVTA